MKKTISALVIAFGLVSTSHGQVSNQQQKEKLRSITNPSKTALVIIDIQNDYFTNGAMELYNANERAQKASKLLKHFRDSNFAVIHIQHIATDASAGFFLPNTEGVKIHSSVAPLEGEKVITKNYPNSFRDTELLDYLNKKDISNLVIVGMMTDVCVDATTRAAMDYGFSNTIISDAVTTRDRELNGKVIPAQQVTEAHLAGLNALGGLYADIKTSEEYLKEK